jgi:uncharacterized phage protein (TIGR02218 family)
MRQLSPELATHLASGATTLAKCVVIERRDGQKLGFTSHDITLTFEGVIFEPDTGVETSETASHLGFAVGGLDIAGALQSDALNEDDLAAGLFDDAKVEVWIVNWTDISQRHLLHVGYIGEVRRQDEAFAAEVRGAMRALDEERGRRFGATCDAELGDAQCGVNLASFTGSGTVSEASGRRLFKANGLDSFAGDYFSRGLVTWVNGANTGLKMEVKTHRLSDSVASIELWQPMAYDIAVGDTFNISAGCDKRFETCKNRFANVTNFRGFPHMPGNDFALSYPSSSSGDNDGGAL